MEAFLVTGGIYIGLSYLLTPENADGLLAGYNTLSKERKKLYDITSIVRLQTRTIRFSGLCIAIIGSLLCYLNFPKTALFILIFSSTVPLVLANLYCRLKYSKDPMRWYDWVLNIGMLIGCIMLTYIISIP